MWLDWCVCAYYFLSMFLTRSISFGVTGLLEPIPATVGWRRSLFHLLSGKGVAWWSLSWEAEWWTGRSMTTAERHGSLCRQKQFYFKEHGHIALEATFTPCFICSRMIGIIKCGSQTFILIICLTEDMYLGWTFQTPSSFLSGRTRPITGGLNVYFQQWSWRVL